MDITWYGIEPSEDTILGGVCASFFSRSEKTLVDYLLIEQLTSHFGRVRQAEPSSVLNQRHGLIGHAHKGVPFDNL